MKFNININQYKLAEHKDITIQDCAVIDWLYSMFGSDHEKINKKRIEGWTWISLPYLIDDMPLLRIKTNSGASKLINRVKKLGYIETKTNKKERKLYAKPTIKMRSLYFSESPKTQVLEESSQVLQETAQVPQDTNQYTSINTLNKTTIPPKVEATVKEVKEYNYKEEVDKLLNSNWKVDKIIALYFLKKRFNFENQVQFNSEYKRNLRPAKELEGYNSTQIEQTMNYLEDKGLTWTLNAIGRNISNVVNKK